MKKRVIISIIMIVIIAQCAYLNLIPLKEKVEKSVEADIYISGNVQGHTSVRITGEKTILTSSPSFLGRFAIDYYDRTCRDDMQTHIKWNRGEETQTIIYSQNASYPALDINTIALIDAEMNEFALGFKDGTIIATSQECYNKYNAVCQIT